MIKIKHQKLNPYLDFLKFIISFTSSERPASRHFSLHRRLSSAKIRQYRQVCAARSKSRGCRKDKTYKASSFGNNEIKSLWNCGSITDIICRTWVGWHLPMSWSIATRVEIKFLTYLNRNIFWSQLLFYSKFRSNF